MKLSHPAKQPGHEHKRAAENELTRRTNDTASRSAALSLLFISLFLFACGGGSSSSPSKAYTALSNPEKITLLGYGGEVMEPFVSRDGVYLFFNNAGGEAEKDMFYGTFVNPTTVQFVRELTEINSIAVDGVPTLDESGNFYFISTIGYAPPEGYDTLFSAMWNGAAVSDVAPIPGLAIEIPGLLNFDIEVSEDGDTLYFNDGDFRDGNPYPNGSNLAVAVDSGGGFARHPDSAALMAKVNTDDLEYAAAISANQLELFFTRLFLDTLETRTYRATRKTTDAPFGTPQHVTAITGFAEAATYSPDEKSIYYHKLNTDTGKFELYRVTRD